MSKPDKVIWSDVDMLNYFVNDVGDITRWCDWEERKEVIARQYPGLVNALEQVRAGEQMIRAMIELMKKEVPYE